MGAALSPPDFDRRTAPMHVSAPVYCEPKLQEPRQHPPPYKNIWFYMLNRCCQKLAFILGFWIHFCHGATFVSVWLPDPHLYSNSLHSLGAPFFARFGAQPAVLQNLC